MRNPISSNYINLYTYDAEGSSALSLLYLMMTQVRGSLTELGIGREETSRKIK